MACRGSIPTLEITFLRLLRGAWTHAVLTSSYAFTDPPIGFELT
jgi:hypothetical protein